MPGAHGCTALRPRSGEAVLRLVGNRVQPVLPQHAEPKTKARTRPVGRRPLIELEPTDHPLAVEQHTGITEDRLRQNAEAILHPNDDKV